MADTRAKQPGAVRRFLDGAVLTALMTTAAWFLERRLLKALRRAETPET